MGERQSLTTVQSRTVGITIALLCLSMMLVLSTAAKATVVAPEPKAGAEGLPDGRVFEQVSPAQKGGNEAGYLSTVLNTAGYSLAEADGESILFEGDGPYGESATGADRVSVARRSSMGWQTQSALPPGYGIDAANFTNEVPQFVYPSPALAQVLFTAPGSFVKANPIEPNRGGVAAFDALYLATHLGTADEPAWLSEPTVPISGAKRPHEGTSRTLAPAGGSSNFGTAYFTWGGTLVPEDASRTANIENGTTSEAAGFYEYSKGVLKSAGELPVKGQFSPYGAVPASFGLSSAPSQFNVQNYNHETTQDGERAFFVSPDPNFCGALSKVKFEASSYCTGGAEPVELYVREQHPDGIPTTVLLSRDVLSGGVPAAGYLEESGPGHRYTTGVTPMFNPTPCEASCPEYMYASPDGSRVFFESKDALAESVSGEVPSGGGPWTYEFDLGTETLTYLPSVVGPILGSSRDGSRFVYANINRATQAGALDLWVNGQIKEVATLPKPEETISNLNGKLRVAPMEATTGGAVFVFQTDAPIVGFNNSGGHEQVYRYMASSEELTCVSCPPRGIDSSEDAHLTNDEANRGSPNGDNQRLVGSRGMSADGGEVFFDTPDALVPQDANHHRDVYEWEQAGDGSCPADELGGCRFLISSGRSRDPSIYLDNSEDGRDVFFATTQSLVPSDSDESYDVYDARLPHHPEEEVGFGPLVTPAMCNVDACQGAPEMPPAPPITLTASSGLSGNQSMASSLPTKRTAKPLTKAQKRSRALKACLHVPKRKRAKCIGRVEHGDGKGGR